MSSTIQLVCTFIAIIACLYASYTDLKSGIIQNKLTFSLIGVGIILNAVNAFIVGDIWLIVYTLIITAVIFVVGYILWKFGAWAGGDVKLFTALAALIPFYPAILNYNLFGVEFPIAATYSFPFTLIINSLLSILPFLLIYVLYIAVRKKPYLLDELLSPIKKDYKKNIVSTLVVTSAFALTLIVTSYFNITSYLQYIIISLISIYLLTLVISKLPNRLKAIIISVLIVFALYTHLNNLELAIIAVFVLFILITAIGIIRKLLTSVNKEALQDDYKIEDLKEGMIPAYNMYELENEIYIDDKSFFEKIRGSLKSGDATGITKPNGKLLIGSMAAGLTNDNIELLKKLFEENKIENKVRIKRGVPFAPSIFIGLLISLFIGDLALILQKILYLILY